MNQAKGLRSEILLGALACVALANGVLLGLSLYGLLATVLHLLGSHGPGIAWGLLAGALVGIGLLVFALREERLLREGEYGPWQFAGPDDPAASAIVSRLAGLVASSTLDRAPSLWKLESLEPNAFTVARSRDEAAIAVSTGLLDLLGEDEQGAVLAHHLAHIEAEDIKAVGLADAIVACVGELTWFKGRFLWGPRRMVDEALPFIVAFTAMMVVVPIIAANNSGGTPLGLLINLGLFVALVWTAFLCWRGLAQIFLFVFFFGPLTLIEMALAVPTGIAISRLVSRGRIYRADARAVQLTGDPVAYVAALEKLAAVERSPEEPRIGAMQFGLFVAPRPQHGYRSWLARFDSTHPSIASRIEVLREAERAQDDSRAAAIAGQPADRLEQSG